MSRGFIAYVLINSKVLPFYTLSHVETLSYMGICELKKGQLFQSIGKKRCNKTILTRPAWAGYRNCETRHLIKKIKSDLKLDHILSRAYAGCLIENRFVLGLF
jgi:hypothetical protein